MRGRFLLWERFREGPDCLRDLLGNDIRNSWFAITTSYLGFAKIALRWEKAEKGQYSVQNVILNHSYALHTSFVFATNRPVGLSQVFSSLTVHL